MKNKPEQPRAQLRLRRWTKKNLRENDYAFARSENGKDCLAAQLWKSRDPAAMGLVAEMLDWELFRELNLPGYRECKRKPYLDRRLKHAQRVQAVRERKRKMPTPDPLEEVPLASAMTSGIHPIDREDREDEGISTHALRIDRYEDTEITVARFRKWVVGFKQTPDPRPWRANLKKSLAQRGALRFDATLRALAVRRLKLAGYNREDAERLLGLKKYALNPRLKMYLIKQQADDPLSTSGADQWAKQPALAEKKIQGLASGLDSISLSKR